MDTFQGSDSFMGIALLLVLHEIFRLNRLADIVIQAGDS